MLKSNTNTLRYNQRKMIQNVKKSETLTFDGAASFLALAGTHSFSSRRPRDDGAYLEVTESFRFLLGLTLMVLNKTLEYQKVTVNVPKSPSHKLR